MTKITKRQYAAKLAEIHTEQAKVQAEIEVIHARIDSEPHSAALEDAYNAAHDRERWLGQEEAALHREWRCRDWTSSDYATAELVAQNID